MNEFLHPYTSDRHAFQNLELFANLRPDITYGFSELSAGNMSFRYSQTALEDRRAFLASLNIDLDDTVAMSPIHGDNIEVVDASHKGAGAYQFETAIPKTDGLITEDPTIAAIVHPADCAPIMIVHKNSKNPLKGIFHAGKAGTDLGMAPKAVDMFRGGFGVKPEDLLVAIGPAILCYPESPLKTKNPDLWLPHAYTQKGFAKDKLVVDDPTEKDPTMYQIRSTNPEKKLYTNLVDVNLSQLLAAGVPRENIDLSKICTYCNALRGKIYSDMAIVEKRQSVGRFMAVVQ